MNTSSTPPEKFCDIVMKGGITSGVVYPRAITEIAGKFTLKSVGGTSAGAIAAAAAAAAELGRRRGGETGGFPLLEKLPELLCRKNASGRTNLFTFFQPQPETRELFQALSAALNAPSPAWAACRVLWSVVRQKWPEAVIGALPGIALAALAIYSSTGLLTVVTVLLGALLALAGALAFPAALFVRQFGRAVPDNGFGLCSGMGKAPASNDKSTNPDLDGAPLTVWLTAYLNRLAGLEPHGEPLTFGQLWDFESGRGEPPRQGRREVDLEMMTTCLTWGRPFRLPFQDEPNAKENRFYFRRQDFEKLFPGNVVEWLCANARPSSLPEKWRKKGFVPLPEPWNLPVVVATRMSLSFPILLSTVPLYAYDQQVTDQHREETPPAMCRFSDGGICSNFPMHLFDSPVPRWPTFAINLLERPEGTSKEDLATPRMPRSNNDGIQDEWNHFDHGQGIAAVIRFCWTIIATMQNWSDHTLSRLPGFRDRTAHVGLTPSEGGLNLDMPQERIDDLCKRGAAAGREFVRRFASDEEETMNWDNHRWLRMRSLLASLEDMLVRFERSCAQPVSGDPGYELWLQNTPMGREPSYKWQSKEQRELALETVKQLRALAKQIQDSGAKLEDKAPRPRPQLRPRPRI